MQEALILANVVGRPPVTADTGRGTIIPLEALLD
jgi:hypothetical protein